MLASILAALVAIFQSIPIFAKYFPPKTSEEKIEEGKITVDEEIKKIEETGRP